MMCLICGGVIKKAKIFYDHLGNKIHLCKSCLEGRQHRIEYKYGYNCVVCVEKGTNNED